MTDNILNLGCGNDMYGTHRVDMFQTPATTHVLDISSQRLPFPDNFFSEIRMYGIIEHTINLGFLIDEVYRVAAQGACIDVSTDHAGWIFWYLSEKREHNNYLNHYYDIDNFKHEKGTDSHVYLFVESHLKRLFSRFRKVYISYGHHGRNKLIRYILALIPRKMGAREIRVLAIK